MRARLRSRLVELVLIHPIMPLQRFDLILYTPFEGAWFHVFYPPISANLRE